MIDRFIEPEATKRFRWAILDEKKAKKLNICLMIINPKATAISLDFSRKPKHIKSENYLGYLQEKGIITNNI